MTSEQTLSKPPVQPGDRFLALIDPVFANASGAIAAFRARGVESLSRLDFPGTQMENWKYTAVKPHFDLDMELPGLAELHTLESVREGSLQSLLSEAQNAAGSAVDENAGAPVVTLVLVNGLLDRSACQNMNLLAEAGLQVLSFEEALNTGEYSPRDEEPGDYFSALNQAGAGRGIYVRSGNQAGTAVLLHIVHQTTGANHLLVQTRNIFSIDRLCRLSVIESFENQNPLQGSITNSFTEVFASEGARVSHILIQKGTLHTTHITREVIHQERDSTVNLHTFTLSGKFTRNDAIFRLKAPNADAHMYGFYQVSGSELCDNHTLADHLSANCTSNELYKGILRGKSTAVFNGKVFVHPDAQKTNAYQQNNSIILDSEASMNSKPELEIYADDVKCSHGSTIGQLDENSLFYLRARGISESSAKSMLLAAFANELISRLEPATLRDYLSREIF